MRDAFGNQINVTVIGESRRAWVVNPLRESEPSFIRGGLFRMPLGAPRATRTVRQAPEAPPSAPSRPRRPWWPF